MQSSSTTTIRPRPPAVHPQPPVEIDPVLLTLWGPGPHGLGPATQPIR